MLSSLKRVFIILFILTAAAILGAYYYNKSHTYYNEESEIGNTAGNLYNGGLFCQQDNIIYFSNDYDQGSLYRMDSVAGNIEKVSEDTAVYINADDNYIYYVKADSNKQNKDEKLMRYNNGGVYRINENGTGFKAYIANPSAYLMLKGNYLYFQRYDVDYGISLERYKIDGTRDRALELAAVIPFDENKNSVYYTNTKDQKIIAMDLSSYTSHPKYKGSYQYPYVFGDYVYYINPAKKNHIYRMKKDGTEPTLLVNESCSTYNITNSGKYLYYQVNGTKKNSICRLNLDNMKSETLLNGAYQNIHVTDNYVFFNNLKHTKIYMTLADGGTDVSELITTDQTAE